MTPTPVVEPAHRAPEPREKRIHHVAFTAYPKLLYVWPLIVAGFAFWPIAGPPDAPDYVATIAANVASGVVHREYEAAEAISEQSSRFTT
jgi:hypothetical protein